MFNIAPYLAKYVRALHVYDEPFEVPYSHTQFGVVLMVDVVGFSTLTTLAQEKGNAGAEAMAMEIGAYMGECIQIIEFYGGDVVKFLGDAVLVCFQPINKQCGNRRTSQETAAGVDNFEATERQKNLLVRRGLECGLQLLARLSHYRVYLTSEGRSKHRASNGGLREGQKQTIFDAMAPEKHTDNQERVSTTSSKPSNKSTTPSEEKNCFTIGNWLSALMKIHPPNVRGSKDSDRRISDGSRSSLESSNLQDCIDLELHMSLSCGNVTNIVLGDPLHDYVYPQMRPDVQNATLRADLLNKLYLEYHGRLEYAIGGDVVDSLDDALSSAKAGEMSIAADAYNIVQRQGINLNFEKRGQFYVIKNIAEDQPIRKINQLHPLAPPQNGMPASRKSNSGISNNADYLRALPGLKKEANTLIIEPLTPRIRNTDLMHLPAVMNRYYFKYVSRSALFRMKHSMDGHLPAQFREVTIMFVSLGKANVSKRDELKKVQDVLMLGLASIVKCEGMLQQFAIDDKGATMLVVFGLPPLSHEREAVFAAKAALAIRDSYLKIGFRGFAISLSTGVIFTAVLPQGNPYRCDPGIAGDPIVVAVRMLKFPFSKENVVCDPTTKKQIGGLCEFEDFGENHVKGKVKPVQIFGIKKFGPPERENRISILNAENLNDFIGYRTEMKKASVFVDDWTEHPNHHLMVVSGPSGVGKSFFCNKLHETMTTHGVLSCWSSTTEVEKASKYYLLRSLLVVLFEIVDSEKIPSCKISIEGATKCDSHFLSKTGSIQSQGFSRLNNSAVQSTDSLPSPPSSIDIPISREFVRRHSSYVSAMSLSPLGSLCNSKETTNDMERLVLGCLQKCGEETKYVPLLKAIFTNLNDVDENNYTKILDARARDIILTGLITRIVHHVSKHAELVFFCDNIQWADSASIRVLQHVHEHCERLMILMATRPRKDYNINFIEKYQVTGSHEQIDLNGLGEAEIGEIILQNFNIGVNRISPEIVKVIQNRTGGNPLYVQNMAIILKDFNHVTVVEGELVPNGNSFDLEDLVGNFDYRRTIKMQFDRLDSDFQEFLTVASCLDQYFTVFEIGSVIKASNSIFKDNEPEQIQKRIEALDVYHFLQQASNENHLETDLPVYSFAHITIPQSINDMILFETRIYLHSSLARYYERQLYRDNYAQLIRKITRHYLQTDSYGKQLYFLEALAELNMEACQLPEATKNLQKIVQILDKNEDLLIHFGQTHLSDIYRHLGDCYTMRTKFTEGQSYLFKALEALGEPWPKSSVEYFYKIWKNKFRQYRHRKCPVASTYSRSAKREHDDRVIEIMVQLSNIYYYTGYGRDFVYACLLGLNACERIGDVGSRYTLLLARSALHCWLNNDKENSILYITKALRLMGNDRTDTVAVAVCSILCFAAGKFSKASDLMYRSIEGTQTQGVVTDCQGFYRFTGLVITMRIFGGTFHRSPKDMALLRQMADTAHSNGDLEAEVWLSVYNIGNAIVMDRMSHCSPYIALLENHLQKEACGNNEIAMHGTLVCYYARNHMHHRARCHIQRLINITPSLNVTPNTFPIYGLIFMTMGLYYMFEDGQIDLVSNGDAKNYEKFMSGIGRLIQAFQKVKFWEYTLPCFYLARALPYIVTRRFFEGYAVLRNGLSEMHYLDEIRFLRAYYWSKMGKFAFTPKDRIEWTDRAKKEFHELGIPAHTYLNPDPGNIYYRGLPADVCWLPIRDEEEETESTTLSPSDAAVASTSENVGKSEVDDV